MSARRGRDLGERGTQPALGLDRTAPRRELGSAHSRQMAELVRDGTLLSRNEQKYQANCLERIVE